MSDFGGAQAATAEIASTAVRLTTAERLQTAEWLQMAAMAALLLRMFQTAGRLLTT